MEEIKRIKQIYNAKRVALLFMKNSVIVALDVGTDLFETCSLTKPIAEMEKWRLMYYQIYSVLTLCDSVNRR